MPAPASGSTISIPVTLTVRAAAPIAASVSSLTFTYRAGDAAPPAQTVQISGGGPSPTFTIQVPDSASWLKASPHLETHRPRLQLASTPPN